MHSSEDFGLTFFDRLATVWIYPPEFLPLKTRAKGASLAASADFLGDFLVVEFTPTALKIIRYKTYIIFTIFNVVNAITVWRFYPKTAGLTLESVDRLFVNKAGGRMIGLWVGSFFQKGPVEDCEESKADGEGDRR